MLAANRFYNAFGAGESCYFDSGFMPMLRENDFEPNAGRCLTALGMFSVHFTENWFERNTGAELLFFANERRALQGNYLVPVSRNWFELAPENRQVLAVSGGQSQSSFTNNSGTRFAGKRIAPAGARLSEFRGNYLVGALAETPATR